MLKAIESSPGLAFASRIAWRSEPGPESAVVVTSTYIAVEAAEVSRHRSAMNAIRTPAPLGVEIMFPPLRDRLALYYKTRAAPEQMGSTDDAWGSELSVPRCRPVTWPCPVVDERPRTGSHSGAQLTERA